MRLALAFGRTAGELEDTMAASEWQEWQMFQDTEPLGEERMDWRFGTLAALLYNTDLPSHVERRLARDFVFMPEYAEAKAAAAELNETSLRAFAEAWGSS